MKSFAKLREHPWLPVLIIAMTALFSVGCKSSRSDSGTTTNPLGAFPIESTGSSTTPVIDGTTDKPGSSLGPVISVPEDGSSSIDGHDNAPLLDNKHAGWQQSSCLTCHSSNSLNPDHNYPDDTHCYLCHGTNGLPGFGDTTPPVLSSVVVSPQTNAVTISWKSDEPCLSRLVLKTIQGDKMEFPVTSVYNTSHKYTVNGLQSGTTYYYELISTDKSGNKTSSATFSSVLTFQTTTIVTPGYVPGGDPGSEDESTAFFKNIKVTNKGDGQFLLSFETREAPQDRVVYWYLYDESQSEQVYSDDFNIDNNKVEEKSLSTGLKDGTYYIELKCTLKGITKPYYSKKVKLVLKSLR